MEHLAAQIILAFIFGVIFVVVLIVLAVKFPNPTSFQRTIFRITLSLAAAGVAAMIPGFINLDVNPTTGLVIRAGGALAIFVIVFFFNPADRPEQEREAQQLSKPFAFSEQVAAVCYRLTGDAPEFLLVKTTGGRWTFPKGNVDEGEEQWFAAKREAFEEAGAYGDIEHEPLTLYTHEKREWKEDKGIEIKVRAFLMRVTETQKPRERKRNPTWFSADDAQDALAEDRGFKYAEEFRRVIRQAITRINSTAR